MDPLTQDVRMGLLLGQSPGYQSITIVMMPEMDGGELSRAIDSEQGFSNIPVILLNSLSDVKGSGIRLGDRGDRLYIEAQDAEIRGLILKSLIMATISKPMRGVLDTVGGQV